MSDAQICTWAGNVVRSPLMHCYNSEVYCSHFTIGTKWLQWQQLASINLDVVAKCRRNGHFLSQGGGIANLRLTHETYFI
jgi:hypothetical protein